MERATTSFRKLSRCTEPLTSLPVRNDLFWNFSWICANLDGQVQAERHLVVQFRIKYTIISWNFQWILPFNDSKNVLVDCLFRLVERLRTWWNTASFPEESDTISVGSDRVSDSVDVDDWVSISLLLSPSRKRFFLRMVTFECSNGLPPPSYN